MVYTDLGETFIICLALLSDAQTVLNFVGVAGAVGALIIDAILGPTVELALVLVEVSGVEGLAAGHALALPTDGLGIVVAVLVRVLRLRAEAIQALLALTLPVDVAVHSRTSVALGVVTLEVALTALCTGY
jgi:hypothetical protein